MSTACEWCGTAIARREGAWCRAKDGDNFLCDVSDDGYHDPGTRAAAPRALHEAYYYRVVSVRKVVDGDTVDLSLDLGFYMTAALRFRVIGVDAPERGKSGGVEATEFVRQWLTADPNLTAYTRKADSFGRWLCDVYREDGSSLSAALLEAGHAVPYVR